MSTMPRCIRCGSNAAVYHDGDRNYFCRTCKICFDDDPEEGGDYSMYDPAWRLQREENRRERMLGRRRG